MTTQSTTYTRTAIVLHWAMAILFAAVILVGLIMGEEDLLNKQQQFAAYQLHKSLGFSIFALFFVRILWRMTHKAPDLPATAKRYEIILAKLTHHGLYALMAILPITGWICVSASPFGIPTLWFGLFEIPHLPVLPTLADKADISEAVGEIHETLAWATITLIGLHIAAAAKHYIIDKDDILTRMIPFVKPLKK